MNDTTRFLETIAGGVTAPLPFRTFDDFDLKLTKHEKKSKNKSLTKTYYKPLNDIRSTLIGLNNEGAGIFVTINKTDGKGICKENILKVNAVFIDIDDGRRGIESPIEPSIITESKHGIHCYWLVDDSFPVNQFSNFQNRLINYFNSDKSIKDIGRVMRVPGFYNMKDPDNPYLVTLSKCDDNRYRIEELNEAFPESNEQTTLEVKPEDHNIFNYDNAFDAYKSYALLLPSEDGRRNSTLLRLVREGSARGLRDSDVEYVCTDYALRSGLPQGEVSTLLNKHFNEYKYTKNIYTNYTQSNLHSTNGSPKSYHDLPKTYPTELAPELAKDYVSIIKTCTDGPESFILGSFFSVFGALCSRFFSLPGDCFLNDYYLLVGKSGVTRKTTIQNFARKFYYNVINEISGTSNYITLKDGNTKRDVKVDAYNWISNGSVEGVITKLSGSGKSVVLGYPEYKSVFDLNKRNNQGNTISRITEMYDCNKVSEVNRSQEYHADHYSISILGCSTQGWLQEFFSKSNASGGFINRHLLFYGEPADTPLPYQKSPDEVRWQSLVKAVASLFPDLQFSLDDHSHGFSGEHTKLKYTKCADSFLKEYNEEHFAKMKNGSELYADLISRETTHASKLAGIYTILNGSTDIDSSALLFGQLVSEASSKVLIELSKDVKKFDSNSCRLKTKLLKYIVAHRTTNKRDIAQYIGGKQSDVNDALSELTEEGLVLYHDQVYSSPNASNNTYP